MRKDNKAVTGNGLPSELKAHLFVAGNYLAAFSASVLNPKTSTGDALIKAASELKAGESVTARLSETVTIKLFFASTTEVKDDGIAVTFE